MAGIFDGSLRDVRTAHHLCYFPQPSFIIQLFYVGFGAVVPVCLIHFVMACAFGTDLWQVRDADHLHVFRHFPHDVSHAVGNFAGYAGVNFVKNDGWQGL